MWNVGTGYFGCGSGTLKRVFDETQFRENATRDNCKMIELKLSQGAKPVCTFLLSHYIFFHYGLFWVTRPPS